ncbi:MAG: response regulator [Burkholderiales bacterium]
MRRIMLIDDEIYVLRSLHRLLARRFPAGEVGIELFDDPREALVWAGGHSFDLAISDYRMARMDGVTLLRQLRDIQPDTVRMIVSGAADQTVLIDAINKAQIYRFIAKPWDDDELVAAVGDALHLHDGLRDQREIADELQANAGTAPRDEVHDSGSATAVPHRGG